MNNTLKLQLRKMAHNSKFFSLIYHKASDLKTDALSKMSDEEFLKRRFKENQGYELNLENPQTFCEKLQWLKLHDRKPIYTVMADKFKAKAFVAESVGEEFVVPLYGVWKCFDDIDFSKLPNQFVLKCNHDCGSVVVCKDKKDLRIATIKKRFEKALSRNYYYVGREWPYKNIEPVIIAEKYLGDNNGKGIVDYKVFCYNGIARSIEVCTNRVAGKHNETHFDREWNRLPFKTSCPVDKEEIKCPKNLKKMIEISEIISKGIPFIRVDFYEVDGLLYVGELTFFEAGGMTVFHPSEWDSIIGSWIELPKESERSED